MRAGSGGGSLRIAFLNQFYPPDHAPTGHYLALLVRALAARGHRVHVLCSRGAYAGGGAPVDKEQVAGVRIERLAAPGFGRARMLGRMVDYLGYLFLATGRLLAMPRPDLVLALTTPPFLGVSAAWAARIQGTRHAHWVMDVYPDCLAAHGWPRQGWKGTLYSLLQRVTRTTWMGAAGVAVLGPAMRRRMVAYRDAPVAEIPLWAEAGLSPWPAGNPLPLRAERGWNDGRLTLCYSGNLGFGHRWQEFAAAVEALADAPLRWVFAGGGQRRSELETWARARPTLPIEFLPYAHAERLREHLCAADVHLASMEPGWEGCIVPSKVQNIFAVGRPLLAVAPAASETAHWIRESGGGWVVEPGDTAGVVAAVREALDRAESARRGEAAAVYAQRHFSAEHQVAAMVAWVETCCAVEPPAF